MKRITLFSLAIAVGFGATACERGERTARQELSTTAREDPGYESDAPASVTAVPDTAGGQTLFGNLAEMNNSGTSGVVTVTPQNGQTQILLAVSGAQPNTQVRPTIHRGGCDEVGRLVHELQPIRVEGTGLAEESMTLNVRIDQIADGWHSVRVYPQAGYQSPPIACAELPTTAAETRI